MGEPFFSGHEVDILSLIHGQEPDLILIDTTQARSCGFALCAAIKRNPSHANLPVILVISAGDADSEIRGFEAGAVDVVARPLNSTIFRARMNTHLTLKKRNDDLLHQISERLNVKEELRQKHDMLARLTAQVPGTFYQYRLYPDGRHTCPFVSESVRKDYGLTPEQLNKDASPWLALLHPDDRYWLMQSVQESAETLQLWRQEYRVILPNIGIRDVVGEAFPEKLDDGSTLWHGYIRDVNEHKKMQTAIKDKEQLLRLFIENAPASILMLDKDMRHLVCSNRLLQDFQLNREELIGRNHYEVFPFIPESWREAHQRCLKGETIRCEEDIHVGADGKVDWVRWEITPWYVGKDIGGMLLFTEVITEHKLAEDALRRNKAHLRLAHQAARMGSFEWNVQTDELTWSPEKEMLYGLAPGSFDGRIETWLALIHHEDRSLAESLVAQALNTGILDAEWRVVRPDGEMRWLSVRAQVFHDDQKMPLRMVGINMDITERKLSEKILKLTQFSIERAAEPMFWIMPDMRIYFANEAACRHLGYTHEELLSLKVPDIDPTFSLEACNEIWARLKQEKSILFEGLHRTKDGRLIPVEISSNHIEYEGHEYNCTFVRDITERKQAEHRIHNLTRLYSALSHCNQAIVRSSSEQELFQEICRVVVEYGGMKMAWIGMLDRNTNQVQPAATYGISPEYLENMHVPIESFLAAERDLFSTVIKENRPVWCQDYLNSDFSVPAKERAIAHGWNGLSVLPLHRKEALVGTFALYAGDANAFDEAAQSLLLEIAIDIDFALDNFDRAAERDSAIQSLRESEARYSELFANNATAMLLTDPESSRIVNANKQASEFYGWDIETLKTMHTTDINPSPADEIKAAFRHALKGRERFFFQHRLASGELRDVELISGPVIIEGRKLLLASVYDITERKKAKQELESSRERLAELSAQLIDVQEQEKKSLARELHDELGQRFTSLNITLHHMKERMSTSESMQIWQKAADDVAMLTQRVRDISHSLRPSMLDYLGLGAAVEYLLKEHFSHSSIRYVFEYAGLPDKLRSQTEITAYRIVQEAITNVVRHSKATQAVIELNGGEDAKELEIVIRDNGIGFDFVESSKRGSRSGIGLSGMKERVKLVGGEFNLKAEPGSGTRIDVSLPLK